jgi:polyhydroxyalkanoate synthase
MPRKTHLFYLRNMYVENNLVKPGTLTFLGEKIDLGKIDHDIYAVGTVEDHIVPWQSAFKIRKYVRGPVRFVLANSGHIAGIINPPGGKGAYFVNESATTDPEAWLAGATQRKGSWWEDWLAWLGPRSGKKVAPPPLGNETYKPVEPAPGSYVREMGGEVKYRPEDVEQEAEAAAAMASG